MYMYMRRGGNSEDVNRLVLGLSIHEKIITRAQQFKLIADNCELYKTKAPFNTARWALGDSEEVAYLSARVFCNRCSFWEF